MLLPGVASLASGLSYPVVRGSVPAATGFFLDGVRIPQLYHLGLGPSVVHPALIDGIDFYPANAPSGYGNLTAGVVAAQLKEPRDKLHIEAQVESVNAGAFVELPIPQTGTDITLAGRFSYTGWFLSAITDLLTKGEIKPVADFYDYQARVEQKVGKATIRLLAFGSSDLVGAVPKDPEQVAPYLVSRFHRIDLRGRVPVGPGTFEAGATVGWEDLGIYAEKKKERVGAFLLSRFLVSGRAQWRVELSKTVQARVSADVERQLATIENTESLGGGDLEQQPRVMGVFSGVAAEVAWNPDRFWLVAGLRGASYHAQPGVQFWALEPRLSARYALADWLTVKGGAGLFHQPPTILLSLPISDLASLKDGLQETIHLALGFEARLPLGLELSVEGYFNPMPHVLEKSLTEFITGGTSFGDRNPAIYGQAYGLEVLLRAPAKGRFFGWLAYSLSRSERLRKYPVFGNSVDDVQVREGFVPFAFDQTHNLNLVAGYQLPHAWKLSGTFHFNTGRPESGEVSSRTQVPAVSSDGLEVWRPVPLNQVDRLPAFFRIDARVSKAWTLNDVMLELYIDVFNATFTPETYAWTYGRGDSPDGVTPGPLTKTGFSLPLFSWALGLKGSY